jgi:RHH-type rel operon transcriptional repressor/antitoxin RelB
VFEMLALRLQPQVEQRLENLAKKTGRTKSYYAKLAIQEFLEEQEAYLLAVERLEHSLPSIPLNEVEQLLGLAD